MNKFRIKIFFATIAFVSFVSCDIEPIYYSQVAPDTYYDSKEAVLQRFYRPFTHARWTQAQDPYLFYAQELGTDAFCSPVRGSQNADRGENFKMHYHEFPLYNEISYQIYISRMAGVARCWAALDDLGELDLKNFGFADGVWTNWVAQIKALAGLNYLEALDFFGGMPLYEKTATEEKPRSSDKETFYFTEKLLKESIPNLEKKQNLAGKQRGDITQAAAALWLARLYFNAESYIKEDMYQDAAVICQDILDGKYGTYELDSDWTDIFGFDNEQSKEIIWSIPSERAQLETDAWYYWKAAMPVNMSNYFGGIMKSKGDNQICLTPSYDANGNKYKFKLGCPFSKFEDTDVRKKQYRYIGNGKYEGMFFYGELVNPDNPHWKVKGQQEYCGQTLKLVDQIARISEGGQDSNMETGEENSGIRLIKFSPRPNVQDVNILFNPDIPLARLTEVYYILAECKMRMGDKVTAAKLINTVRRRYFENGNDPNPVTSDNLDKYRMLDEWLIEFLGECRRRTDLIRWNEYVEGTWWDHQPDGAMNAYKTRFPISLQVLDPSKKLEQNPGY